jgi:hypothetical protein
MTAPFIGEIKMFGGNFAPRGYATCEGQLISIAQNTALFALIGTIYGGNGQTTYSLPDLRGRIPIHQGITNTAASAAPKPLPCRRPKFHRTPMICAPPRAAPKHLRPQMRGLPPAGRSTMRATAFLRSRAYFNKVSPAPLARNPTTT